MNEYLTIKQAAERLGVPERTVLHWVQRRWVAAERFGDVWAVPEAEVERLKAEGRPRVGLARGTKLARRFTGTCQACGTTFQAARKARFCSPRCSARYRYHERKQGRQA